MKEDGGRGVDTSTSPAAPIFSRAPPTPLSQWGGCLQSPPPASLLASICIRHLHTTADSTLTGKPVNVRPLGGNCFGDVLLGRGVLPGGRDMYKWKHLKASEEFYVAVAVGLATSSPQSRGVVANTPGPVLLVVRIDPLAAGSATVPTPADATNNGAGVSALNVNTKAAAPAACTSAATAAAKPLVSARAAGVPGPPRPGHRRQRSVSDGGQQRRRSTDLRVSPARSPSKSPSKNAAKLVSSADAVAFVSA